MEASVRTVYSQYKYAYTRTYARARAQTVRMMYRSGNSRPIGAKFPRKKKKRQKKCPSKLQKGLDEFVRYVCSPQRTHRVAQPCT